MIEEERRTKKGLYWTMEGPLGAEVSGFQPDSLSTKTLEQAENNKEMLFISIRKIMEDSASKCMDDEDDRLDLCQRITRWVYQNRRKIT